MSSSDTWEFNCPQFVDFTSADSPGNSSNFFGDRSPRGVENAELSYSKANSSVDMLCMTSEHKRFATANFTDSQKCTLSKQLGQRLSKSDGDIARHFRNIKIPALEDQISKKATAKLPSKSRTTCPTTPMCLRRTIVNASKKFKTSEELEMEKIAELQKKTRLHIRNNELNLRKMKQKRETNESQVVPHVKRGLSFKVSQKDVAINVRMNKMNLVDKSSVFQRPKSVSEMKTIAAALRQPGYRMLPKPTFSRNVPDFSIKPLDPAPSQASDDECFLKPSNLHTGHHFGYNKRGCSLKPGGSKEMTLSTSSLSSDDGGSIKGVSKCFLKPSNLHTGLRFRTNSLKPQVNKEMTQSTSSLSSDDRGNIKEVPKKTPYRFSYNKENVIARRQPTKALEEVMRKVQAKMAAKSESAASLPRK